MYIVIMRHGIAESGYDDYARRLTEEGASRLRAFMPLMEAGLRECLPDFDALSVHVRCSPKRRARETADVVSAHFGWGEPVEDQGLLHYGFASVLRSSRASGDDLVFWVGHDPMCSVWSEQICQDYFSFRKGAAALIDMGGDNRLPKPLLWYERPSKLD